MMTDEQTPVGESDELVAEEVGGFNGGQHEQRPGKAAKGVCEI